MGVNLNDKRLTSVYDGKDEDIADEEARFDGMIAENDATVQKGIDESKAWMEEQQKLQNEQTDLQIDKIEQQKEQSQKDYIKEQSGAYVDWQKESSKYGAKEEQLAAAGLTGSGYHESTQVSLYNTYQNRVAVARDAFERTKMNYENAINEAKLQNSSILAEIAFEASKEQLTLTLEGLQYKNSLLLQKASAVQAIEDRYYKKWQDVLAQINAENELALSQARLRQEQDQFDARMKWEREQFEALHSVDDMGEDKALPQYNTSLAGSLAKQIADSKTGFKGVSYDAAVKYLTQNNKSYKGLLTSQQWQSQKVSPFANTANNAAAKNYSTYAAYLKDFVDWAMTQKTSNKQTGKQAGTGGTDELVAYMQAQDSALIPESVKRTLGK